TTPFPSDSLDFTTAGRNLLHLSLFINGKQISFLNGHLAWAKTTKEQLHQTQQGEILIKYLQTVVSPFIFTGDFNLDPENPLIKKINTFAKNLIDENHVITTLNPRTHAAKVLFPPGAAVDYIFVTPDITVKKFDVLKNEDLSDHFGLTAELEL
ncbi:MAG TPA: endonuclease/exonuclease/phosphatase family protein, partial [Patescibacteria group bacterium]|nr:endonuclease/exonuclease/phosphatase family protein [Patescibacteria group bacterium]